MSEHTDVEHPERDQRWHPLPVRRPKPKRLDRNWSSLLKSFVSHRPAFSC